MLITDQEALKAYTASLRLWQGIPGIEVTKKGRIFSTFYSGGTTEQIGNYCLLLKSDDGIYFGEPIAAAVPPEAHRCYDPCLWIDPLGRLWFIWSVMTDHAVYAAICDDPDADVLTWHEPRVIGHDVMMNKPVVLTTGEWLFPIAVWRIAAIGPQSISPHTPHGAFAYKTIDNGENFTQMGFCAMQDRSFDEHMIVELQDGRLMMLVRTNYGIGVSYSYDRGKTWSEGENSGYGGPCSRFFIRRLSSGRLLLINHVGYENRNRSHLTALLSEDDGITWKYSLLLDERNNVSYPDAAIGPDGSIYITYDRERGAYQTEFSKIFDHAREILIAKITEEDIIAGKLISDGSYLKHIISKLGAYEGTEKVVCLEPVRWTDKDLALELLKANAPADIPDVLFNIYPISCVGMNRIDYKRFDELVEAFKENGCTNPVLLKELVSMTRRACGDKGDEDPIIARIKQLVEDHITEDFQVKHIADALNTSSHYICHLFKRKSGITIVDYRNSIRFAKAKRLLINSDMPITNIAAACGMNDASYFSKLFLREEGITPTAYRQLHKTS